jgi:serine/threonine protein kinase
MRIHTYKAGATAEDPSHRSSSMTSSLASSSMVSSVNTASIVGLGTVGWRAPELLNAPLQHLAGIAQDQVLAVDEGEGGEGDENADDDDVDDVDDDGEREGGDPRLSRKVDVFSVGCIIQYVLTHGGHPFGEVLHEREQVCGC